MQEISAEKRLQLVHQIRQEHTLNRQALRTREQILYGKESGSPPACSLSQDSLSGSMTEREIAEQSLEAGSAPFMHSTLGIRFLIAVLLFLGYFLLAKNQISFGGVNAEVIRSEVNRYSDVEINLFDFMDNITYTLNTE